MTKKRKKSIFAQQKCLTAEMVVIQKNLILNENGWKMEDFQGAFLQRNHDVSTLDADNRKIAAMHLGGVAIECLLKHMLLANLPKGGRREWKTDMNNPGHSIMNPGHSYQRALNQYPRLRDRIQRIPAVRQWLDDVENPGSHFINMRYKCDEPDAVTYKQWHRSYKRLREWLLSQGL